MLYDLTEFLKLSAVLGYQLSISPVVRNNILTIILGKKTLSEPEREVMLHALEYTVMAYNQKKRRLGSLSVLHPLRATALLSRALGEPGLLDLLTELLHDKLEDIKAGDFDAQTWTDLEVRFASLEREIEAQTKWYLMERIDWLTRKDPETYCQYIGRLLDRSRQTRELVRVKLADRLDNTLDLRTDLEDPIQGVDFFATIFEIVFVNAYRGYKPDLPHPDHRFLNGADRLYQLFKNIVLLSLVRQKRATENDPVAEELFRALAVASMKEAQRVALHIFGHHRTDLAEQRQLLLDTMSYVQKGGIDQVTLPGESHRLDGLFLSRFEFEGASSEDRQEKLDSLYQDKPLMIQASLAFVVIFLSFLHNPDYLVRGVSENGIRPDPCG